MTSVVPLERFPTGIAGLDKILYGGLLRGGFYTVTGPPGTGKTVLGNQVAFSHVERGHRALYLTLLMESHSRMITYLGGLGFFDPKAIPDSLEYLSTYRIIEQDGLPGLLDFIRTSVRERGATLIVFDGFSGVADFVKTPLAFKRFLHDLHAHGEALGCTTLLLSSRNSDTFQPEDTVSDGIIRLERQTLFLRSMRQLSILKFRGSPNVAGKHDFEITSDGVVVFPRTESVLSKKQPPQPRIESRCRFELPQLDDMMGGGPPAASMTLVMGPSGSGKTGLGLQFLHAGIRAGERGLHVGFYEHPEGLAEKARSLGLSLASDDDAEFVKFAWRPATEQKLDGFISGLIDLIRSRRIRRLTIDGLNGLPVSIAYPERTTRALAAFANELKTLNVTTIVTFETPTMFGPALDAPIGISSVVENIIFVRYFELGARLRRIMSVLKMRDSKHDHRIREFELTSSGVVLSDIPFEGIGDPGLA